MRTAAVSVVVVWWTVCLVEEIRYRLARRRAVFASRGAR